MGYVSPALPADILAAEPPQLTPIEKEGRAAESAASVLLATMLAVPAFRTRLLQSVGVRTGGRVEVLRNVRFRGDEGVAPADGLVRSRGQGALFDMATSFEETADADINRVAAHLSLLKACKLQRVVTVSNTVPDQAFVSAVRDELGGMGLERLRAITWMDTIDIALHLLERRKIEDAVGAFLLRQYIRFIKDEAVRELQAKSGRPQGALFFTSLGADWRSFAGDVSSSGTVDPKDPRIGAIAANWLAFTRFLALTLTRGAPREEDVLVFPSVQSGDLKGRRDTMAKRLRASGELTASFRKETERLPTQLRLDLKRGEITLDVRIDDPTAKGGFGTDAVREVAGAISEERTLGTTAMKIFWPGEKQPRSLTPKKAAAEPIATAPPQHGMTPDALMVERRVPCQAIIAEPQSLTQLLTLELRGFRASTRHIQHKAVD
jgi:hypothetical protein